jgi:hypothetical protein
MLGPCCPTAIIRLTLASIGGRLWPSRARFIALLRHELSFMTNHVGPIIVASIDLEADDCSENSLFHCVNSKACGPCPNLELRLSQSRPISV